MKQAEVVEALRKFLSNSEQGVQVPATIQELILAWDTSSLKERKILIGELAEELQPIDDLGLLVEIWMLTR